MHRGKLLARRQQIWTYKRSLKECRQIVTAALAAQVRKIAETFGNLWASEEKEQIETAEFAYLP